MVRTRLGLVSVNAADYVASVVPDKSGIVGGDELLRYRNEFACRDTD